MPGGAEGSAPAGDDRLAAWRELAHLHAVVTRDVERTLLERCNLALATYEVLARLERAGGRLRMRELAREVVFSRSGASRLVDRMATDGLVDREPCPDDGRGTYAVLTAAGRDTLTEASPVYDDAVRDHLARRLGTGELRALRSVLAS